MTKPARLWLDDLRDPPGDDWLWFTEAPTACDWLERGGLRRCTHISLDHDLGVCKACLALAEGPFLPSGCLHRLDGYVVACAIERMVGDGAEVHPDLIIRCHSDNPAGRQRIELAIKSIMRRISERRGE